VTTTEVVIAEAEPELAPAELSDEAQMLAVLADQLVCERPAEFRGRILKLESALADLPQIEAPLHHRFAPGMYTRECHLPAGSVVIGKIHRHEHLVMLLSGEATIATEAGLQRYVAPAIWNSQIGAKRLVFSHTDTVFMTFHPTNETDLEKVEAEIIAPDYAALGLEVEQ
jgi:hypothetical protein